MTILAVSISADSIELAKKHIKQAIDSGAEAVELRTDFLHTLETSIVAELIAAVRDQKVPVIVTCRDRAQGGVGDWPLEKRINILQAALDAGADFIDCEFINYIRGEAQTRLREALQRNPKARLILSAHNFSEPFGCEHIEVFDDLFVGPVGLHVKRLGLFRIVGDEDRFIMH